MTRFEFQLPQRINYEWLHKVHPLLLALEFTNRYINHGCTACSVAKHATSSRVCHWCYSVHTQTGKCAVVLPPCLLEINLHDILQNKSSKEGIRQQKWNFSKKKTKNDNACCEIWRDGNIQEIHDCGKRLYTCSQRSLIGWMYQHKWKGWEGWQKR